MSRRLLLSLALLVPAVGLHAQAAPVTVFVVRHAEKGPEPSDPSLTAAGERRARALARVLGEARVTAIFASEFRRTRETIAPLAAATGLTPIVISATNLDSLVSRLGSLPPGSRAVVSSHSNLVHLIVERLSGVKVAPLTDVDYDRLAVVTVTGAGKGEAVVLRYGEP